MYPPFSAEDLSRLKALLDDMTPSQPPDPYLRLLSALEPFLTPDQQQRLPKARALVRFLRQEEESAHD